MLADPAGIGNALLGAARSAVRSGFLGGARRTSGCERRARRGVVHRAGGESVGAAPLSPRRFHRRRSRRIAMSGRAKSRVRAFAEWRLLEQLARQRPAGAEAHCGPVSAQRAHLQLRLDHAADCRCASLERGAAVGCACRRPSGAPSARRSRSLHRAGVDHADLNAHNILLDAANGVSVIDFDRGRLRVPGVGARGICARLQRSLSKISAGVAARALYCRRPGRRSGRLPGVPVTRAPLIFLVDPLRSALRICSGVVARTARPELLARAWASDSG